MKNQLMMTIASISGFILGLILIGGSYFLEIPFFLLLGILVVLLSVLSYILIKALNLFIMDRELNIEALKKAGLTIVKCNNCLKDNVLEDQYCVHCGERLGKENEISEEHKA